MKAIKILLTVPLILSLIACGGGGGGGEPAVGGGGNTPRIFSLAKYNSVEYGNVLYFEFTGYDTDDIDYTGTYATANENQIVRDGVLVTPRTRLITLAAGGASISLSSISLLNDDGGFVDGYMTDETYCYSQSPDSVPNQVIIGDFGTLSTLVCDNGTTQERDWQVVDAGNGNASFIAYFTVKDEFGSIIFVGDQTLTIAENGDFIAGEIVETLSNGYTLTLISTEANNGPLSTSPTVIEP